MNLSLIWLNLIFNNNYSTIINLINSLESSENIIDLSISKWKEYDLSQEILEKISSQKYKDTAKNVLEFCQKNNIKIANIFDENYPINLKYIQNPPTILFYLGELLAQDECSISVVGSRNYTEYGRIATEKIVTDLAKNNITIVSGMARGIDTYAHISTLNQDSRTIAVLGCGVNVIYPTNNTELYHKIIKNGAVLSEFLPNTKPYSWNFPTRNRIISGISLGTLVIEANIKSGTMTTANWASDQGKNVYAVPGNIFSEQSKGTNKLISEGAKIVTSATDILEDLHGIIKFELDSINEAHLDGDEKIVFDTISTSPISIYEISFKSGLPINKLNSVLTILELEGYIKKLAGDNFIRESKYIEL